MTIDERTQEVSEVVAAIRPLLAGRAAEVQGGVLADLVALFLAGHHTAMREEILQMHIALVRELIPVNEQALAEDGRYPPDWSH